MARREGWREEAASNDRQTNSSGASDRATEAEASAAVVLEQPVYAMYAGKRDLRHQSRQTLKLRFRCSCCIRLSLSCCIRLSVSLFARTCNPLRAKDHRNNEG